MSILYFLILIMLGHFMLLNLFLAILLKNVEQHQEIFAPSEKRKAWVEE